MMMYLVHSEICNSMHHLIMTLSLTSLVHSLQNTSSNHYHLNETTANRLIKNSISISIKQQQHDENNISSNPPLHSRPLHHNHPRSQSQGRTQHFFLLRRHQSPRSSPLLPSRLHRLTLPPWRNLPPLFHRHSLLRRWFSRFLPNSQTAFGGIRC